MTNKLMLVAIVALISSAPAVAQETPNTFDSRWTPYLGCWTVLQDRRFTSAPNPAGTMVCVRPSGRFGVAVTTTVEGKDVLEQTIVADGSPQPISQGDCSGTQTSDWSRDGERLFTRVELTCANRPKRSVSGITMLANGQWVDAQATIIDGNADIRLRRYRRSSDRYTGPAGMTTAPLSIEDIIEASAKVQSEALEAALDETNARFTLNSRVLKQLADNGVASNVIDLLVAQAYPEKFEVQRGVSSWGTSSGTSSSYGTAGVGSSSFYMGSTMYPFPMYDPFYSSYYYYSPFAYPYYWGPSYSYRYGSPFYRNYYNYNYYGFSGPGYYYGGPSGPSGGGTAQPGSADSRGGDGVVVNGRGYTRVRPAGSSNTSSGTAESATPSSRSTGTRGVRSAGESGSSSSSPSSSSSSSSSSSGSSGTSSGGYSSGGGGGGGDAGGGRTAQPR